MSASSRAAHFLASVFSPKVFVVVGCPARRTVAVYRFFRLVIVAILALPCEETKINCNKLQQADLLHPQATDFVRLYFMEARVGIESDRVTASRIKYLALQSIR